MPFHLRCCRRQGLTAAAQAWAAAGGSSGGGSATALAALAAVLQQPAAALPGSRAASSAAWESGSAGLPAMPRTDSGGSGQQPQIRNVQVRQLGPWGRTLTVRLQHSVQPVLYVWKTPLQQVP